MRSEFGRWAQCILNHHSRAQVTPETVSQARLSPVFVVDDVDMLSLPPTDQGRAPQDRM